MLDIAFILENKDIVRMSIKNRGKEPVDFGRIEELYTKRTDLVGAIGENNRKRKEAAAARDTTQGSALKQELATMEDKLRSVTKELTDIVATIPNIPSPDVPIGADESDNVVMRQWGEKPPFAFEPKAHWDIGKERGLIDNERAAKVVGSRFTYLKGGLVRLQFALIQWVLETVGNEVIVGEVITKNNLQVPNKPFTPIIPPVMITPEMFFGMARLEPREERYYIPEDNLFLIGSAEHTLGSMHASEMFAETDLPLRYIGYSTSFRREAGSYGKDTKGILRQHQFDKLEFQSFTVGEKSKPEQDLLVALQEHLMQQLNLPYQVVAVCTGDMGGPDIRQIDIEVWMPGQQTYRETHSADLMGEYQNTASGYKGKTRVRRKRICTHERRYSICNGTNINRNHRK